MPEWKGPSSLDRFTALLDFQRTVDVNKPSHCAWMSNSANSQSPRGPEKVVSDSPQLHNVRDGSGGSRNSAGFSSTAAPVRVQQQHHHHGNNVFSSSAMEIDDDRTGTTSVPSFSLQSLPQLPMFSPRVFMFNALKRVLSRDNHSNGSGIMLKRSRIMASPS